MADKLSKELDSLSVKIEGIALNAYKEFMSRIESGESPQQALDAIYKSFTTASFNAEYVALLAESFSRLLEKPFTPKELYNYRVGNLGLSSKLYINGTQVAKDALNKINEHLALFHDLKKLSLDLFSGYEQKSKEILTIGDVLPKYIKNIAKEFSPEIDREIARLMATSLKTDALRAAYLQFIEKLEKNAGKKALEKALRSALYEKSRYLANRIAATETARAYALAQARKIKKDDNQYVQIRPSGNHEPDQCDMYLYADPLGLGAGIYRKAEAPVPPFHPHCRCRLISLVNVSTKTDPPLRKDYEQEYFNSLTEEEQKKVLPAQWMRDALREGQSITQILNSRSSQEYFIKTLEETMWGGY